MSRVSICGVNIDNMNITDAVSYAMRQTDEPCMVVTPNALMLEHCAEHPDVCELLNAASLVLPDGAGVVRAARRQGTPLNGRAAGIDFAECLMAEAARDGSRVFLLGGKDGVAEAAAEHLRTLCPGLRICGCYWGYFDKLGEENCRVVGMVRACRPDILLVGFGFPLQESWLRENLPLLPSVRVAVGLGGSFDVWAGACRRAPAFLRSHGMEWAWRMAQEPARMRQIPALLRFAHRTRR